MKNIFFVKTNIINELSKRKSIEFSNKSLINTDKVMNDSFWLGVYPGLKTFHLDYIYKSVNDFIHNIKSR